MLSNVQARPGKAQIVGPRLITRTRYQLIFIKINMFYKEYKKQHWQVYSLQVYLPKVYTNS